MILSLATLTASSQSVVPNNQLKWLLVREADAVYYEKVYKNCDSISIDLNRIISSQKSIILLKDSTMYQSDTIIKLHTQTIAKQLKTITKQGKAIKRNRFIVGAVGVAVLVLIIL